LPLELIVLCKINFKVDTASKIILISYSLCFLVRAVSDGLNLNPDLKDDFVLIPEDFVNESLHVLNSVCDRMKWLILYIFILTMQDVRIKVESETH